MYGITCLEYEHSRILGLSPRTGRVWRSARRVTTHIGQYVGTNRLARAEHSLTLRVFRVVRMLRSANALWHFPATTMPGLCMNIPPCLSFSRAIRV